MTVRVFPFKVESLAARLVSSDAYSKPNGPGQDGRRFYTAVSSLTLASSRTVQIKLDGRYAHSVMRRFLVSMLYCRCTTMLLLCF